MSGVDLFAEDILIGVVLVDADTAHPERLELWALPAHKFSDNPSPLHQICWNGGERRWNRSMEILSSEMGLLRRLVESNKH